LNLNQRAMTKKTPLQFPYFETTYATYLLEKGVDLYYIQRSLGHSDIYTTQIYAYISNKDLKTKIEKAFSTKTATSTKTVNVTNNASSDPMEILKLRYAAEKITRDELEEKIEV